jgi:hypothetical protein
MMFHAEVIPPIEAARDSRDWFKAVVLCAIQLERYGYLTLKKSLDSLEIDYVKDSLEKLFLPQIALFLLAQNKVTSAEYHTILSVNTERNRFVHRKEIVKFLQGPEAGDKYTPLVNESIRILSEKLGVW